MKKLAYFLWPVVALIALFSLREILQSPTRSAGARLYQVHCQNCHMEDGQGLKKLIPPLKGSSYLANSPTDIPCLIRKGIDGPMEVNAVVYDHPMPANPQLSDEDIYQLMLYMYEVWVDSDVSISRESIQSSLEDCQ